MEKTKTSIEAIKHFFIGSNLITIKDMECHSIPQLVYMLADKINTIIKESTDYKDEVYQALKQMSDELDELLRGGKVEEEILKTLEQWRDDGTFNHLIQSQVFKDFNNRLEQVEGELPTLQHTVDTLEEDMEKLKRVFIDANDLGCVGDGESDDTLALQNAIEQSHLLNATLVLNGIYNISQPLNLKSNVKMVGKGETKIISNVLTDKPIINIVGECVKSLPISSDVSTGATTINVNNSDGINNNSIHILKSQRSAFSEDAGLDYRLGTATTSTDDCYLGEFVHVVKANPSSLELGRGLIFPDYKPNNVGESGGNSRPYSTIEVLSPVSNVEIKDIVFEGLLSESTPFIKSEYAIHVNITGCSFVLHHDGVAVFLTNTYQSCVDGCRVVYTSSNLPTQYYYRNGFKIGSGQEVVLKNCKSNGMSGQPFDITYIPNSIPSIQCHIEKCTSNGSTQTGVTLHPGTFSCVVSGCVINARKDGITLRGQNHQCINNLLTCVDVYGTSSNISYGIGCAEGYGNNIIVSGNKINRFPRAFRINESNTSRNLSYNKEVRLLITNNIISNYCVGVFVDRPSASTTEPVEFNTLITGNIFNNLEWHTPSNTYALYVTGGNDKTIRGVIISNNTFNYNSTCQPSALFRCDVNGELVIVGNVFNGLDQTSSMGWFYGSSTRQLKVVFKDNLSDNTTISLATGSVSNRRLIQPSTRYVNSNSVEYDS